MTERPNKELADRYWSDQTLKAWYWSALDKCWVVVNNPWFGDDKDWHVGHEAPTKPPTKMCELAGIKFPMPLREAPAIGSVYWYAGVDGQSPITWRADKDDLRWLGQGVCHATQAAAQAHSDAFLEWNRQAIEGAK